MTGLSGRLILRWGLAVLGALVLFALAAAQWERLWAWSPWSTQARLERAQAQAALRHADALARAAEAAGQGDQVQRIEAAHARARSLRDLSSQAQFQARSAPDANQTLDPDRYRRLRDLDRELCGLATATCVGGDLTPSDPAGGGAQAVRDRGPAG